MVKQLNNQTWKDELDGHPWMATSAARNMPYVAFSTPQVFLSYFHNFHFFSSFFSHIDNRAFVHLSSILIV